MRIFSSVLCVFLCTQCAPTYKAQLAAPSACPKPSEYEDILQTWTRSARIYHFLDNRLFITATFHASHFKHAFASAFPHLYGHGGVLTRKELANTHTSTALSFLIVTYTPYEKWNDFNEPDSIWNMELHTSEGVVLHPTDIVPVKIDENIRAVYPYIKRFERAYLVHFPVKTSSNNPVLTSETTCFSLQVASALGKALLEWHLTP